MIVSAQNNLNILRSSIFDFNVGDEFQYSVSTEGAYGQRIKKIVTGKVEELNGVCYEMETQKLVIYCLSNCSPGIETYTFTNEIQNECYMRLNDTMNDALKFCKPDTSLGQQSECSDCKYFFERGCLGTAIGDSTATAAFFGKDVYFWYDVLRAPLDGSYVHSLTYAAGLGLVESVDGVQASGHYTSYTTTLKYYKKGTETKGTPLDFSVAINEILTNDFHYAVQNNVIDFSKNIHCINLYNVQGQMIHTAVNTSQVNLNDMSAGIYFIQVNDGDQVATIKFIKN